MEATKKSGRGGARPGSGRKPIGIEKATIGFVITAEEKADLYKKFGTDLPQKFRTWVKRILREE